jgi:glucose/arabinose dehydrogenase
MAGCAATAAGSLPGPARAAAFSPKVVEVARGLEHPWSLAFLPDGTMLVTERPGRLRIVTPAGVVSAPVAGVPAVRAVQQGGLLDVARSPGFERDRTIFLSYAEPSGLASARTAVARAELAGHELRNLRVIFRQRQDSIGGMHFGCRLVFGRDGTLFATLGERFTERARAQDLSTHYGKVVRIRADGSVPADNPFVKTAGALPEIWSYGHRNPQGAALHPSTGRLWTHEHGPQGGDEVNLTLAGRNYGWPVITHGREYVTGTAIGEGTAKAGMEQPLWQWTPSIAPSGMAFCTSDRYPGWKGSLLVGALKFMLVSRLELDGEKVLREERLLADFGERIRDVREGPDGQIWLLTDNPEGRLLRLAAG